MRKLYDIVLWFYSTYVALHSACDLSRIHFSLFDFSYACRQQTYFTISCKYKLHTDVSSNEIPLFKFVVSSECLRSFLDTILEA